MKAITVVEDEVREVITDYDERSVAGTLPQLVDTGHVARAVFDAVAGFGPLQKYLDDPTIEEVWTNGRQRCRPATERAVGAHQVERELAGRIW